MNASPPPKLLTVNEVADALGCGRTLVYELLGRRELHHIKIGRLTRISPSEVERFVRLRMGQEPERIRAATRSRTESPTPVLTLPFAD